MKKSQAKKTLALVAAMGCILARPGLAQTADYKTVPARITTAVKSTTVGATVVPYKQVTLSAQIPGDVSFIAGREGDRFKAGDVLVAIDDAAIRARRRAAVASYMSAQSALRNARVQYSREVFSPQTGRPTGMGIPSMFDSFFKPFTGQYAGGYDPWVARNANLASQAEGVETARSRILQAGARIEEIDSVLRDARLRAPFDGVIIKKMVEKGDTMQPGQPLLDFAQIKFLRIRAEVPVKIVRNLQKGMMVKAQIDVDDGVDVQARVAQIYPVADQLRHTVTVKFDLPRGVPGGPGMYAEVQIPDRGGEGRRYPTIPRAAVFSRGSLSAVYVLEAGKPVLRLVRLGAGAGSGDVSVLSGLAGNEQVLVEPKQVTSK